MRLGVGGVSFGVGRVVVVSCGGGSTWFEGRLGGVSDGARVEGWGGAYLVGGPVSLVALLTLIHALTSRCDGEGFARVPFVPHCGASLRCDHSLRT